MNALVNDHQNFQARLQLIFTGSFTAALGSLIGALLSYAFSVIAARALGAKDFGTLSLGIATIGILSVFCKMGLDLAMIKVSSDYNAPHKYNYLRGGIIAATGITFISALALAGPLYFMAGAVAVYVLNDESQGGVIKLFAAALPLLATWGVLTQILRGLKATWLFVISDKFVFPTARVSVLLAAVALAKVTLTWAIIAHITALLMNVAVSMYLISRVVPDLLSGPRRPEMRNLMKLAWPLYYLAIIQTVTYWTDTVILALIKGADDVGVYAAAASHSAALAFVLVSVHAMVPAVFADLHREGRLEELDRMARISNRWCLYAMMPLAATLMLNRYEVMAFFGTDFFGGAGALLFLSAAQLVNAALGSSGYVLMMSGHENSLPPIFLIVCIINILINTVCIYLWGATGAGFATGASLVILCAILAKRTYDLVGIVPGIDNLGGIAVSALVGGMAFLSIAPIMGNIMATASFGLTYFLTLYWIAMREEDLTVLRSMCGMLRSRVTC